jgi:hypothetical protein
LYWPRWLTGLLPSNNGDVCNYKCPISMCNSPSLWKINYSSTSVLGEPERRVGTPRRRRRRSLHTTMRKNHRNIICRLLVARRVDTTMRGLQSVQRSRRLQDDSGLGLLQRTLSSTDER